MRIKNLCGVAIAAAFAITTDAGAITLVPGATGHNASPPGRSAAPGSGGGVSSGSGGGGGGSGYGAGSGSGGGSGGSNVGSGGNTVGGGSTGTSGGTQTWPPGVLGLSAAPLPPQQTTSSNNVRALPEPGTLALLATALAGVAFVKRRRTD